MTKKLLIVNLLTFIRVIGTILLIPIYKHYGSLWVGVISLICYATDSVDGFLARHYKVSTFFGALFDGVADKLITIVNFIILYLITPYAIIPIIFEILTTIIQLIKFNKNCNIKSNFIGKLKVWVMAITLVTAFFVSGIKDITFISDTFKDKILNTPSNILYLIILLPAIIISIVSFMSYVIEIFKPNKKVMAVVHQKEEVPIMSKNKGLTYFKNIWLNPDFYYAHQFESNLKDLRKLTKE